MVWAGLLACSDRIAWQGPHHRRRAVAGGRVAVRRRGAVAVGVAVGRGHAVGRRRAVGRAIAGWRGAVARRRRSIPLQMISEVQLVMRPAYCGKDLMQGQANDAAVDIDRVGPIEQC